MNTVFWIFTVLNVVIASYGISHIDRKSATAGDCIAALYCLTWCSGAVAVSVYDSLHDISSGVAFLIIIALPVGTFFNAMASCPTDERLNKGWKDLTNSIQLFGRNFVIPLGQLVVGTLVMPFRLIKLIYITIRRAILFTGRMAG